VSEQEKKDIAREYEKRKRRQVYAIFATLLLLFAGLWKIKHPGLFLGALSKDVVSLFVIVLIALFALFSFYNWRCPGCGKYMGSDIHRKKCRKCGIELS